MNRLTSEELREMREYTEAATAGPWEGIGWTIESGDDHVAETERIVDATFIAKSRTDMPRLLDGYATLQDEVARLKRDLAAVERALNRLTQDPAYENMRETTKAYVAVATF